MRRFIELHPSMIYLILGIVFFIVGDLTLPAVMLMMFIIGKLEKTVIYNNIANRLQKHF